MERNLFPYYLIRMSIGSFNNRPLSTYPIPPSLQIKLSKAGFLTAGSVVSYRPAELSSSKSYQLQIILEILL